MCKAPPNKMVQLLKMKNKVYFIWKWIFILKEELPSRRSSEDNLSSNQEKELFNKGIK